MPILMKIYLAFFTVIVFSNIVFSIKLKMKRWVITYELVSGILLLFMTSAYWFNSLKDLASIYLVPPFILVMVSDIYFSVFNNHKELSKLLQDVDKNELELASAMSVAFTAPAYICSALLSAELIQQSL